MSRQEGKESSLTENTKEQAAMTDRNAIIVQAAEDKLARDISLSLIHISEPTRLHKVSRMPSSA